VHRPGHAALNDRSLARMMSGTSTARERDRRP
jgi:hypothetical protein